MTYDENRNYWEELATSSSAPVTKGDMERVKAQLEEVSLCLAYLNYEIAYHREGGKASTLEDPRLYLRTQPYYHGYETFALIYNSFLFAVKDSEAGLKPALLPLLEGDAGVDSITMHLLLVGFIPPKREADPLLAAYLSQLIRNAPSMEEADFLLKSLYSSIIMAIVRYLADVKASTVEEELAAIGLRLQTVLSQDMPHE